MAALLLVMPDPLNMDVAAGIALPKMLSRTPCIFPNPVPPMIPIRVDRAASIPGAPPPARSRMACIAPVVVDPKPEPAFRRRPRSRFHIAETSSSGLYAPMPTPTRNHQMTVAPCRGKLVNRPVTFAAHQVHDTSENTTKLT